MSDKKNFIPISEIPELLEYDDAGGQSSLAIDLRWPTDINTGETQIDLDRICVNRRMVNAAHKISCLAASQVTEYNGRGQEERISIGGINFDGTATAVKSLVARRAEKPRSLLRDDGSFDARDRSIGVGWPIAVHQLNRTAINEHVVDLTKKHPYEDDAQTKAWARALDHELARSMRVAAWDNLVKSRSVTSKAVITPLVASLFCKNIVQLGAAGVPVNLVAVAASNAMMAMAAGIRHKDLKGALSQLQAGLLLPAYSPQFDRYAGVAALTRSVDLVTYRK